MKLRRITIITILFLSICFSQITKAQEKIVLSVINENTLAPIPGSTIVVDFNGLSQTRISDGNGRIDLEIKNNDQMSRLSITVKHLSYFEKKLLVSADSLQKLKDLKIRLRPLENKLEEVIVTNQDLSITRNLEKTILHVKESSILKNATLADALNLSPGVSVRNNSISLFGKPGTKILMDGQSIVLGGRDLQDYLNSLTTSNIDKIEIISTPGSQENASSSSGIINIITRKSLDQADINLSLGRGTDWKSNIGANYGRKLGKFNLGLNANRYTNNGLNTYEVDQFNESNLLIIASDARTPFRTKTYSYGATIGYKINPKHDLLFKFSGDVMSNKYNSINNARFGKALSPTDSSITSNTNSDLSSNNNKFLISYSYKIDSLGQLIKVELFQNNFHSNSKSLVENIYENFEDNLERFIGNDGKVKIRFNTYKVDYTLPFKNEMILTTGTKFSDINTRNSMIFQSSYDDGGALEIDKNRSQNFEYTERIWAAYSELKKPFEKVEVKMGLRVEGSEINGHLIDNDVNFKKTYVNFFPHAVVQYKINEKNQLVLNYGRYINRPTFQDLNPFIYYATPYFYSTGNKDLRPEFSDNIELSYSWNSLTLNLGSRFTSNQFVYINMTDENTNITKSTLANLGRTDNFYLSAYYPLKINSWWNTNFNGTVFRNRVSIPDNPSDISSLNSFTGQIVSNFKLGKNLKLNFSGNYNSPMLYGMFKTKVNYTINSGLNYSLLKNSLNLSFSARDIFNTANSSFRGRYFNVVSNNKSKWESRQFTLSLNYTIKKNVFNFRSTSTESEESRIKK